MGAAVAVAEGPSAARSRRRIRLFAAVLAAVAAVSVAVEVALVGADAQPGLVALARGLMVGVPLAVGLHTWYRRPAERFGLVLIVAGAASFVSTLAESDDELLYSLGRVAGWLIAALLVYLFLSFPGGRLNERRDRVLALAMAAVVVVTYLPRLLLAESFELPSPYTSCVRDCPANAFFALDSEPAFVGAFLRPVGVVLVFLVMTAVVVRLRGRLREASPLTRRMLMPVVSVAMLYAGLLGVASVARQVDPTAWPLDVAAWLLALAVPAVAFAFFLGLLQWRLYAERTLQSLAACLHDVPDPATLQRAFADAFKDPSIEIVFPAGDGDDGWLDSRAQPVSLPTPGTARRVTEVRNHGAVVAALVHDEGLLRRPELLEAGASMAAVLLDNQRSPRRPRRRSASCICPAPGSRRAPRANAAGSSATCTTEPSSGSWPCASSSSSPEDVVRQDPERGVARLRELEHELDEALEDLRSLAHGVYPPLLADRGLSDALRSVAMGSSIHVELDAPRLGRYAPEVESAVYFCVLEALQNVLKHAAGARRVRVRVAAGPRASSTSACATTGPGSPASVAAGAGITNMQDRLAAFGGDVDDHLDARGGHARARPRSRVAADPWPDPCAVPDGAQRPRRQRLLAQMGGDPGRRAPRRAPARRPSRRARRRPPDWPRAGGARTRDRPCPASARRAAPDPGSGSPPVSSASEPEVAWPTCSKPGVAEIRARAARRNTGWSSTVRTVTCRVGILETVPIVAHQGKGMLHPMESVPARAFRVG